jgi:hypothetical protein
MLHEQKMFTNLTTIPNHAATAAAADFEQMEFHKDMDHNDLKASLSDLDNLLLDWDPNDSETSLNYESIDGLFLDGEKENEFRLESLTDESLYTDLLSIEEDKMVDYSGNLKIKQEVDCDWISDDQSLTNEKLLQNISSRIYKACSTLNITNDPRSWQIDEVKKWCSWVLGQAKISANNYILNSFNIDGNALCHLTHDEFVQLAPSVGESLYVELELWKNVSCLLSPVWQFPDMNQQQSSDYRASYTNLDSGITTHTSATGIAPSYSTNMRPTTLPVQTFYISTSGNCTALNSLYFTGSSDPVLPQTSYLMSPNMNNNHEYSPSSNSSSYVSDYSSGSLSPENSPIGLNNNLVNEFSENNYSSDVLSPRSQGKQGNHLWQFLKELLLQPYMYQNCIRWLDRTKGIFKIEDSVRVAKLWGQRKNRPAMNYDKLSRSIRQYYKKGIIKKTSQSKRLVYQFCPKYA